MRVSLLTRCIAVGAILFVRCLPVAAQHTVKDVCVDSLGCVIHSPMVGSTEQDHDDDFEKIRIGGFGTFLFQATDYGSEHPREKGAPRDLTGKASIPLIALEFGYKFTPAWQLGIAAEFEYGGAGIGMHYEHAGDHGHKEVEVETSGAVALEQVHITRLVSSGFNVRVGKFIVPMGITNTHHEPSQYFSTSRAEAENAVMPVIWTETGISFFGEFAEKFRYNAMLVTGLDPNYITPESFIARARQGMFEGGARFTSPALAVRLDYDPTDRLGFALAGYWNRPTKNGVEGYLPKVNPVDISMVSAIAAYHGEAVRLHATGIYGHISNLETLMAHQAELGEEPAQQDRMFIGRSAMAASAELGYNFGRLIRHDAWRARPAWAFVRYDYSNPTFGVPEGYHTRKRFVKHGFTAGINVYALKNVVIKVDYRYRTYACEKLSSDGIFGISLNYEGWFFSR